MRSRDQFNQKIDAIRGDMLNQVFFSTSQVTRHQRQAIIISGIVTLLAAIVGFAFALLVSSGITRPVRLLLAGTREVEAGRFDKTIAVSTQDEIGELAAAFNRMIEQLRHNERIRETFGRYIDPKVVQGLIDRPEVAVDGQRRVMTIMFCDMSGFTSMSEGMTPRGLVKVMNHYFTLMSGPIRSNRGIIDKYIGDAIMAYWGPPFVEEDEQALLAGIAAIEMTDQVPALQKQLPDLLGIRAMPAPCDLRIGIATGEVLTGSIGSELMMSFTVMGDAVNLASRLEAVNKLYGTRILISQATADAIGSRLELREIDRLAVAGQSAPQPVFEVMGQDRRARRLAREPAAALRRGARRLPRVPLRCCTHRVQRRAGERPRRRPVADDARPHRAVRRQSAARRLGRRLADGEQIAVRCREKLILPDNDVGRDVFPGLRFVVLEAFDGDTPMTDLEDRLERFETLAAECELITKLATDSTEARVLPETFGAIPPAGSGYAAGNRDQGRSLTRAERRQSDRSSCRASVSLRDLA